MYIYIHMCIFINVCICMYIYIYMYVYRFPKMTIVNVNLVLLKSSSLRTHYTRRIGLYCTAKYKDAKCRIWQAGQIQTMPVPTIIF